MSVASESAVPPPRPVRRALTAAPPPRSSVGYVAVPHPLAGAGDRLPGGPTRDGRATPPARPAAPSPSTPPRVRLVPRTELPAWLPVATTPVHVVPPVLGTAQAVGRPRPVPGTRPAGPGPGPTPLPDPTPLCCAMVQAAVEGLRGVRPLAQLTRWVSPEVYEALQLRAELVQRAGRAPSARAGIRRIRLFRLGEEAAEASVVVDDGPRVRAVAIRLEAHRGRWRAVALEIG
jgi:hypothetical protein